MSGRTLRDYAEEYRALGPDRFREKHRRPVLVLDEIPDEEDDDDRGFHTEVVGRDELARGAGPRREDVFVVQKRAGGAFRDRVGVGRAQNADVCVPLRHVSKYHAYLMERDVGGYTITDAGSKNGTEVGGRLLDPRESEPLSDGDLIRLGPYRFRFYGAEAFAALVARRAIAL